MTYDNDDRDDSKKIRDDFTDMKKEIKEIMKGMLDERTKNLNKSWTAKLVEANTTLKIESFFVYKYLFLFYISKFGWRNVSKTILGSTLRFTVSYVAWDIWVGHLGGTLGWDI